MPPIDEIDRRTDVVFLLFHYADEIRGVTKLQKLLFLVEQETEFFEDYEDDIAFNFAPYKMGPFSEHVYEELEFLLAMDAIESQPLAEQNAIKVLGDLQEKRFVITGKGSKIAQGLADQLESEYQSELADLVEEYNGRSLKELLRYVYTEYPDYAAESEIIADLGLNKVQKESVEP